MRSPGGAEEELTRAPQPFFVISRTTARPRRPAGDAERNFSNIEINTFAAAGANPKVVARMLGHASAAMTLDVYADLFDSDLTSVAESVGKLWARQAK